MGLAIAGRLARSGASVVLADIDGPGVTTAAETLAAEGLAVRSVEMDVSDVDSVERVASLAEHEFGGVDIGVNNAGLLTPPGPSNSPMTNSSTGSSRSTSAGVERMRAASRRWSLRE